MPPKQQQTRRGRKPKKDANEPESYMYDINSGSVINCASAGTKGTAEETIVLRLNIGQASSSSCEKVAIPEAYNNDCTYDSFATRPCEVQETERSDATDEHKRHKIISLLQELDASADQRWPSNTNICCHWCCHTFSNAPFGIPTKYVGNKYHVIGCFCSLECAAAFNFSVKGSCEEIWSNYSLINQLSRDLGHKPHVKPAPNRLVLKMFGGHLSIDDFRNYCYTSKILNVNFPPMSTLTQHVEEISEADVNTEYRYVPVDTDRINRYKEKLKLRRTKPLTSTDNTLDNLVRST